MPETVEEIFSFGRWVRRRRKALDLTQAALAQRVGCAEVTIRKLEADVFRPSTDIADRLAICLDISPDERDLFIRAARGERSVDYLPVPLAHSDIRPASMLSQSQTTPRPTIGRTVDREDELIDERRSTQTTDRMRHTMLTKVTTIWIRGVLNHSLYQEVLIALNLSEQPNAVLRPHDLLVQRPDETEHPLAVGTSIIDVFDHAGGTLLILGAPGAGKTTLLLDLLRDLLRRAEQDSTHPIPVVFPLSTWSRRHLPLGVWLVDELAKRYGVPRKLAQAWVRTDQILPLLDGLDEVAEEDRDACVEAINRYHQEHGLLSLAVCSRFMDYEALTVKLQLQVAIRVQPLTPTQVARYLTHAGTPLAAIQLALKDDPTLWEMLDTPLMLHIVTLTYAEQPVMAFERHGSLEDRRQQLFAAYTKRMLARGSADHPYTAEQTIHWLGWLAWQMQQQNQTVFYVERLQPYWLPQGQQWIPTVGIGLMNGIVLGLIHGVVNGLIYGVVSGWVVGLTDVLLAGLVVGYSKTIESVESLHWSWTTFRSQLGWTIGMGGIISLGLVLLSPLLDILIAGGSAWLLLGLFGGLAHAEIEGKSVPNQGIHRSVRYALMIGFLIGGMFVLVEGMFYGLFIILFDGLFFGAIAGLRYGGRTYLQHTVLRHLLVYNNTAPRKYIHFLEHAAHRILLRRVGGGYMFVHRLLLEYFAAQHEPYQTRQS